MCMIPYYFPQHFFLSTRKSSCVKIWGKLNLAFAVDFLAFDTNRIKAQPKKSDAALAKANIFVRFSAHSSETLTHLTSKMDIALSVKKKKKVGGGQKRTRMFPALVLKRPISSLRIKLPLLSMFSFSIEQISTSPPPLLIQERPGDRGPSGLCSFLCVRMMDRAVCL